jgi:signal transduction histidine kinase/HAMP domain-containing protein
LNRRLTIRTKLVLYLALLISIISCSIYIIYPSQIKRQAYQASIREATSIAEISAHSIGSAFYLGDQEAMATVFASAMQSRELTYIFVTGRGGSIIAGDARKPEAAFLAPPPERWNRVTGDGSIYHAVTPIYLRGSELGKLHLGFSLTQAHQDVKLSRQTSALISLITLVVGIVTAVLASNAVTAPLIKMAATVEVVARGDLSRRAEAESSDEVGDLARAFNTMVDSLAFAQGELEQVNRVLERRVAERTSKLLVEIEERKKVEQALRRSEERLYSVVEHLPEGVLLLDSDMLILLANPAGDQFLATAATVDGDVLKSLVNTQVAEVIVETVDGGWLSLSTEEPKKSYEVTARKIPLGENEFGSVLVIRDVTQERSVREQLQRNERLAAVGQLAAGIAHDFRNILQGMMISAELMLLRSSVSESDQEELRSILENGERGAQLIQQILDFSRQSFTPLRPLDLEELLIEKVSLLERLIPENIKVELTAEPGSWVIAGDPTQIQQVIFNLGVNSQHAMPAGGELAIRLAWVYLESASVFPCPGMEEGMWILLQVSDTGSGIPKRFHDRVFEPFFTTKEPGMGTGLGLAQVYGIVQHHGGCTTFESKEGVGTTFNIYLPQLADDAPDAAMVSSGTPMRGSGELVLAVEDDDQVLEGISRTLMAIGYTVVTATNGNEALVTYERHSSDIHLVLTDVVMPGMGGVELVTELRVKNPSLKVLLMSGYPLSELEKPVLKMPGVGLIQKPVSLDELALCIHRLLR